MDIKIPDSWLREFLETKATPKKVAKYVSLSGASIEKIDKVEGDFVYNVEVTTNRVDMASVYGLAREAATILSRLGKGAKLKKGTTKLKEGVKDLDITIKNDPKLCKRILAIKLEGVKVAPSPNYLQERLRKVNQRPLNNAIDITNYVMWELGHPIHVFDYDRLKEKKIVVRTAKKGESLITLDGKLHKLLGGEVVFDNGRGEIIDLPGIMGTKNSVVTQSTKNILLWIESVDPIKIRQASMNLGIRSQAAVLNEKSVDPELGLSAITRAVELFQKISGAKVASKLVDIYPNPEKPKKLLVDSLFIQERLGIDIKTAEIKKILEDLGFNTKVSGKKLLITPPSFRAHDVQIPEDIVEEVARIYGYHNLPSKLMTGRLPKSVHNLTFDFEMKIKNILSGFGGMEVYTLSLVPKTEGVLSLKNPLGEDTKYLRTSLLPSLVDAAEQNLGEKSPFFLFETANVYLPRKGNLPNEKLTLAAIFSNYSYRQAKGILEAFLEKINTGANFKAEDKSPFATSKRVEIVTKKGNVGQFGVLEKNNHIYFEMDMEKLAKSVNTVSFTSIPQYPAQIEDTTLSLPEKTRVGDIIELIVAQPQVAEAKLTDIFKSDHTIRIWYQDSKKTLTDKEVEKIRKALLSRLQARFGVSVKH